MNLYRNVSRWRGLSLLYGSLCCLWGNALAQAEIQTGYWNSFFSQSNTTECINIADREAPVVITTRNNFGVSLSTKSVIIPARGMKRISLASSLKNSYGTFTVSSNEDIRCHSIVKHGTDYAYSLPTVKPSIGPSSGLFNSTNPMNENTPVQNWLSVYNASSTSMSFNVLLFDGQGTPLPELGFSIHQLRPNEQRTYPLGHPRGEVIGLYKILPSKSDQPYEAFVSRHSSTTTGKFHFSFPLRAEQGSCETVTLPAGMKYPGTSWGEIANPTSKHLRLQYEVRNKFGGLLIKEERRLAPYAQAHLPLTSILGNKKEGSLIIRCLGSGISTKRIISQSIFYGENKNSAGQVDWALASQGNSEHYAEGDFLAVPLLTKKTISQSATFYNRFSKLESFILRSYDNNGAMLSSEPMSISPRQRASTNLTMGNSSSPTNGTLTIESENNQVALNIETLRKYYDEDNNLDYVMNIKPFVYHRQPPVSGSGGSSSSSGSVFSGESSSSTSSASSSSTSSSSSGSGAIDADNDGLLDSWETLYFGDLSQTPSGDPDRDGLINSLEFIFSSHPNAYDTDADGIPDGEEKILGTNPNNMDTDADGISDPMERDLAGSDFLDADTDDDGVLDGVDADPLDESHGNLELEVPSQLPVGISEYRDQSGNLIGYLVGGENVLRNIFSFAKLYQSNLSSGLNVHATRLLKPVFYIKPGTYFEGINECAFLCGDNYYESVGGRFDAPLKIKPLIPGTVTIQGSKLLSTFQEYTDLPGLSDVYYSDVSMQNGLPPRYVWETDTLSKYRSVNNVYEVFLTPGSFFYDEPNERLYLQTSDGKAPYTSGSLGTGHAIEVSYYDAGLAIWGLNHLQIDGIDFRGYTWHAAFLYGTNHTEIKNCVVSLGGAHGIYIRAGSNQTQQNHVTNCEIFGIYDERLDGEGAPILYYNEVLNSTVSDNLLHHTEKRSIRFYNRQPFDGSVIQNNVIDGYAHSDFKAVPYGSNTPMVGNVMLSGAKLQAGRFLFNTVLPNTLTGQPSSGSDYNSHFFVNSSVNLSDYRFADEQHFDYRLQANSPSRGALSEAPQPYTFYTFDGPRIVDPRGATDKGRFQYNTQAPVLYVSTAGNDANDGHSLLTAKRTIAGAMSVALPNTTIYLRSGTYHEAVVVPPSLQGLTISGYAAEVVLLQGDNIRPLGVLLDSVSNVTLQDIVLKGYLLAAIRIHNSKNVKILRVQVVGNGRGVDLRNSVTGNSDGIILLQNVFAGNTEAGLYIDDSLKNLVVNNNLFFSNSPGTNFTITVSSTTFFQQNFFDYNGYFGSAVFGKFNGTVIPSLSSWTTLTGVYLGIDSKHYDIHSTTNNPLIIDVGNGALTLSTDSPYIGRGKRAKNIGDERTEKFTIQDLNRDGERDFCQGLSPAITNVQVYDIWPNGASIKWETPYGESTTMAYLGTGNGAVSSTLNTPITTGFQMEGRTHRIHFQDLLPNTTYSFAVGGDTRIASSRVPTNYSELRYDLCEHPERPTPNRIFSGIFHFTTPAAWSPPPVRHFYFVNNQTGNDSNNGLSLISPWKSLYQAARIASAGDVVFIVPGSPYFEALQPEHQGRPNLPLTFRSLDPETPVILDGRRYFDNLTIESSELNLTRYPISLSTARHVVFQGFHLRNSYATFHPTVRLDSVHDVSLRHIIFDGLRGGGKIALSPRNSVDILVADCSFIGHWVDVFPEDGNKHLTITNSVFAVGHQTDRAAIDLGNIGPSNAVTGLNQVVISNNLFTSPSDQKADGSHSIFYDSSDNFSHFIFSGNAFWFQANYDEWWTIARANNGGVRYFVQNGQNPNGFQNWKNSYDGSAVLLNSPFGPIAPGSSPLIGYAAQISGYENTTTSPQTLGTLPLPVSGNSFNFVPSLQSTFPILYEPNIGYPLVGIDSDDSDGDMLGSRFEDAFGLNPINDDTDGDSIPDWYEYYAGLDPLVSDSGLDTDGDGQTNLTEYNLSNNPSGIFIGGHHPQNPYQ